MIETLQAENVDLKKNLGLAASRQNEIRDKLVAEKFEELLANQGTKLQIKEETIGMGSSHPIFSDNSKRGVCFAIAH